MASPRPPIHGRDHSRGGTDPAFHAWDDVGTSGGGGSGSGSGITEVDSGDGSIFVSNPTGPVVDLSINTSTQEVLSFVATIGANTAINPSWTHDSGAFLLNLTTPQLPKFPQLATYGVTFNIAIDVALPTSSKYIRWGLGISSIPHELFNGVVPLAALQNPSSGPAGSGAGTTARANSGDSILISVVNDDVNPWTLGGQLLVNRIKN